MNVSATLKFLSELKKNNNREWFQKENPRYQDLKKQFAGLIQNLIEGVAKFEPEVGSLQPKDCVFRINRDIRFSNDKSPYKSNFGAVICQGGKKSPKAGYYIHLEPGGGSMLAGGIWMPESAVLSNLRQEIDYNQEEFLKLINDKSFKKYFGELEGDKLKTAPKGYTIDHPVIDILKLKSFVMTYTIADKELEKMSEKDILQVFKAMKPVNDFFNRTFED